MLSIHTGWSYKKGVLLAVIIECPEVGWTSELIDTVNRFCHQGPSLLFIPHCILSGVSSVLMVIGCLW